VVEHRRAQGVSNRGGGEASGGRRIALEKGDALTESLLAIKSLIMGKKFKLVATFFLHQ